MTDIASIRQQLLNIDKFNPQILSLIKENNWLNIWVPKKYNGLELSFSDGLKTLQKLAKIDGSLGWFITLCSGANYFSRNLRPEVAKELFADQHTCFGGSGMLGGTAEKIGNDYLINGLWHYATGAPYLTHFTLNAQLIENGELIKDENGNPKFLSFILLPNQVNLIKTWKSMGMIATSSHSFEVKNQLVNEKYSFIYNEFYTEEIIQKIPFQIFADLTLLVNYIGMAEHFFELCSQNLEKSILIEFEDFVKNVSDQVDHYSIQVENILIEDKSISEDITTEIHSFGENTVERLSHFIIQFYPQLGIKASKLNEESNQLFRDYFTATQHRNFRKTF